MIINLIIIILIIILLWNYILPYLIIKFNNDQNLKSKYNCKWAIVTGGSSGVGESICIRLLSQGISVIIVSKNENQFIKQLKSKYNSSGSSGGSSIKIKSIELDLSKKESCSELIEWIENDDEIDKNGLKLLFNNVGYLTMEGFNQTSFKEKLDMIQCNSITSVELTDYFYKHLIQINGNSGSSSSGAIIFTSSITGLCPTPYSTIYASSKAFITCFAKSLAIESSYYGIDVLVVQPGLINTNLFLNVNDHLILKILRLMGQQPYQVVDIIFRGIGNKFGFIILNSGLFAIISDLCCSILGMNIMINLVYFCSHYIFKDLNCYKSTSTSTSTSINNNNKKNK